MPIRYFIAMCLASVLLAALFLVSIDSDFTSSSDEPTQAVPEPERTVLVPPSASKAPEPNEEPANVPDAQERTPESLPVFPTDRGGAEVERVVSPDLRPQSLVLPRGVKVLSLLSRDVPLPIAAPEPAKKIVEFRPSPLAPTAPLLPVPPREQLPLEPTGWIGKIPVRPTLPAGAPVAAKARDPADLPRPGVLARPPSPKFPVDDPIAEAGNDAVVQRPLVVVLTTAAFIRLGLPDPFAYAEQMRANLSPSAEPALVPVPVTPRRPK